MAHEGMAYHEATGKDVLWSNSMFGGMPTYTTYVAATNVNYPAYVQKVLMVVGKPAYFFFIAMLCFYLLTRVMNINRWIGAIAAFAYAFASNNPIIIVVGHETKMLAIGYLPAVIAGFYLIYEGKWLTGAAIFAMSIALTASTNHFQMMYYLMLILVSMGIGLLYHAIKQGQLKQYAIACCIALGSGLLGLMPNISSVLTTQEYAKETMRGGTSELTSHDKKTTGGLDKEYAFRWSTGLTETLCLMIPYMFGGATYDNAELAPKTLEAVGGTADLLPTYWGERPSQWGPVFFGAVICFLFLLGMMVVRHPIKWAIAAVSALGIVLAWGKNLPEVNYFLFDHVPMLNKFRTVEMALVIPQFLFPLVGAWGLQELLQRREEGKTIGKQVMIAAGVTAGICLLIAVGGSALFTYSGFRDAQLRPEMVALLKDDRASLTTQSALKSAALILAAAALLWAWLHNKIQQTALIAGLALLTVTDILPVALNYLSGKQHNQSELDKYTDADSYEEQFVPREVDKAIMADTDPYYRVLDLSRDPYNDAVQAYFHKCVGGYHPAKMEMYQDLIDEHMSRTFNAQVLNMLNTKYIIVGREPGKERVLPNTDACGNAWFVDEIKWVPTATEEINSLKAEALGDTAAMPGAFDPLKTAVIRTTFQAQLGNLQPGKSPEATVKLKEYGLGDLTYTSNNAREGLAVFADIYYDKGWKAYVDGKETPIVKANYVLRAIKVPAGQHEIAFHFRPANFYNGQKAGLAGSILIMLLCGAALYQPLRQKKG